jgi:acetyltransferase
MSLNTLFYPRAVVIIGSMSEGKLGYELAGQIIKGGFSNVFAVNPKAQGAFNIPGYQSATQIAQPVDLAIIASPAATVADTLIDCGQAGIKNAVIISSGFAEVGNTAGESRLIDIARDYQIRIIGPNCAGIVNTHNHLFATLETRPPAGKIALVSQSGALAGAVLSWAEEQGIGISKFVSYGNRADLDEIQLLPYLAEDPETNVVALYIESVLDGTAFRRVVQEFTRLKPLVVIKSGRTRSGQRAALSHTGSLAGADAVYDAVFRQTNAIRVNSIEDMFDLCKGFTCLPSVHGTKLAIVTNSGGPGILAADHAENVGLDVAEVDPELRKQLQTFLPPNCGLNNPVDLTVEGTEFGYYKTLALMLKTYDAALAINVSTPYLDSIALARGIISASEEAHKPVATSFMAGEVVSKSIQHLKLHGIPNYATGERATAVISHMANYENNKLHSRLPIEPISTKENLPELKAQQVLEPEAMRWLKKNGIPVPDSVLATSVDEAVKGAEAIGFPVVMKVVSPDILHKSEYGGVILNIGSIKTVEEAYVRLQKISSGKHFVGVLVYPMIQKGQEVLLGFSIDPTFGPVVILGSGGIFTEIMHDIALRVAPVDFIESQSMIQELRSYPILKGSRGQIPCDLDSLARVIENFSQLPFLYPDIIEVDLNPVLLFQTGLLVGDVRVIKGANRT